MSLPFIPSQLPLDNLTDDALRLRKLKLYARHPVQSAVCRLCKGYPVPGEAGHDCLGFKSAESHYRSGAQGLRLPQIQQLPQSVVQLSRLSVVDKAGRAAIRRWLENHGQFFDEAEFLDRWRSQGSIGGAEHQVFYDESTGRWYKRLYHCVNGSTLGDYFDRMLLHAAVFPETAYRLEGFSLNSKSKALAPIVSQPHVAVATDLPPVTQEETDTLMAEAGFKSVQLMFNGILDGGHYAYLNAATGTLAHDLHDENVVRMSHTGELAVIDPYLSLARQGTWAAIKLAETGISHPADDLVSE
jgi:hypothetical protein